MVLFTYLLPLVLFVSHCETELNSIDELKIPGEEILSLKKSYELEGGLVLRKSDPKYNDYTIIWNFNCKAKPVLVIVPNTYQQAA